MARNIQSVERAAAMLRLLAGGERRLGLSDIASSLGLAKYYTGSPQWGFLIFAGLAFAALASLTLVKQRWRMTWGATLTGARI